MVANNGRFCLIDRTATKTQIATNTRFGKIFLALFGLGLPGIVWLIPTVEEIPNRGCF